MKPFVFILRPNTPAQPFIPTRVVVMAMDMNQAQQVALNARAMANPALYDCFDLSVPAPQPTIVACERFIPRQAPRPQNVPSIAAARDAAKYADLDDSDMPNDMGGDGLPGEADEVRVQGGVLQ